MKTISSLGLRSPCQQASKQSIQIWKSANKKAVLWSLDQLFVLLTWQKKENSKQDTFLEEVWKLKCDFINTFIILWSVHDDAEISQKKMDY